MFVMIISVSSKRELANIGIYGGGTLLGLTCVALLVLKSGLERRLIDAGIKHTGKFLVASSLLSGGALIAGLVYKVRLRSQPTDERAGRSAEHRGAPHREPSSGQGWMHSIGRFLGDGTSYSINVTRQNGETRVRTLNAPFNGRIIPEYTWAGAVRPTDEVGRHLLGNSSPGSAGSSSDGWAKFDDDSSRRQRTESSIHVTQQNGETHIRALHVPFNGQIIPEYTWTGTGSPPDEVGRYLLNDVRGETSVRVEPLASQRSQDQHGWGPGRRLS